MSTSKNGGSLVFLCEKLGVRGLDFFLFEQAFRPNLSPREAMGMQAKSRTNANFIKGGGRT